MEKIVVTEEMVENAVSYATLEMKEKFVEDCYMRCLNRVSVDLDGAGASAMPNMYMENTFLKSRYLMCGLAVLYLGFKREDLQMEDGDLWLMSKEEYDRWGRSHVIGQLNRFRHGSGEARDKVYDLLRDYGDLERRLNSAIRSGLAVMNDMANRFFQKIAMDVSEESLGEQKKQLEELRSEFEKLAKQNNSPIGPAPKQEETEGT